MKSTAAARLLTLAAAGASAVGGMLLIVLGVTTVGGSAAHVAEAEGRMAAELWELTGGRDAVVEDELLPGRARVLSATGSGQGARAVVPAYLPGALEPSALISVERPPDGPTAPFAAVSVLLLGVAVWTATVLRRGNRHRFPWFSAALSVALPAATAVGMATWVTDSHRELSGHHLAQAVRAASLALERGSTPERAARAAETPWTFRAEIRSPDEQWTMPRPVAAVLAQAGGAVLPSTVEVDGATYHLGAAGPLVLAQLGWESARGVTIPFAATALGAVLLSILVLSLVPLTARPRALRGTLTGWGFLAPSAAHLLAFTFGPLLFSLWLSLHEWNVVDLSHPFVGLAHYRDLLGDEAWWSAVRNTAVFTLHVPVAMAVALTLALLTRGSATVMKWVRLALFLPSVTSIVAIAVVWKWLLNDGYGPVNRILGGLGLDAVPWLTSPELALVSLMIIGVWLVVGYQMVVFQAGLASIPRDWYDAARVDGAGPWRQLWHITLPGLRRTLFFVLVTSVIGSFQIFGLVYVMTEGGPLGSTDVAVYHIYREAWEFLQFGRAAAMSWLFFAVVFVATWLHFRLLERQPAHG